MWNDGPEDWSDSEQEDMLRGVCFGKGGSKNTAPTASTQTVSQTNLPEYAEPYVTGLMKRAETASLDPYEAYGGSRLAQFDPNTTAGFDAITQRAQAGTPEAFTNAEAALTNVAGSAPLEQQAQFGDVDSFTDPGVAQQYMNPYVTNVLDAQKARLNQNFGEQQLNREAQAVQSGAFSNSRRGVQEGIAERELNRQMNEVDAQGLAAAYQSGANIFGAEQGQDMANRRLNTDVFAGNQSRQLDQYGRQISAADKLLETGAAGDQLAFNRAKLQAGVGGALEGKTQQGMDIGFNDFVNQRDFDRNQLNFYSGILRGVPISPQQDTQTYTAPPSQMSQLLGLGIGGLGLSKALG
tara:strand:+ start:1062 stop:2117 length:1056 start_codon:yes stop_codon:yes gene_type:complete